MERERKAKSPEELHRRAKTMKVIAGIYWKGISLLESPSSIFCLAARLGEKKAHKKRFGQRQFTLNHFKASCSLL